MASARIQEAAFKPRSVFVHEILDPTGRSLEWLEERGVSVDRGVTTWGGKFLSEGELIERAQHHVAIMGASTHRVTRHVIEALPDLAFVSKYGIGVDSIDMAAATELGVLVTNTPISENVEAVAEYTIAAMLALRKQFLFYTAARLRERTWRTPDVWCEFLWRRTVGLVGYGRIGRAVARRLSGWELRTLVYDPYVEVPDRGVEQVAFDELLRESDIVSLHAIATSENHHMIDAHALALMKPGAIVVNSARGALVDLDALYDALRSGQLAGVALDAYESEPPPVEHPIFALPNVIATPHASAWISETFERISQTGSENLWAALCGKVPRHAVNPEVLG